MFGYIKPDARELKVKENELYKAVYCGLCRSMGRKTSCASRFTLSYDFVFLALVRFALCDEELSLKSGRCAAHPMKKRPYVAENRSLDYCAYASAILNCGKILDDINDSKGKKRVRARLLLPHAKRILKKAKKHEPLDELESYVNEKLGELEALENSELRKRTTPDGGTESISDSGGIPEEFCSADAPAAIFGDILGRIFSFGIEEKPKSRIAEQIGIHTGKWIYFADAADDFEKDKQSGGYNPFVLSENEKAAGDIKPDRDRIRTSLIMELRGIESAVGLIDFKYREIENILKNIIYLGMPERAEAVLSGEKDARGVRDENGIIN